VLLSVPMAVVVKADTAAAASAVAEAEDLVAVALVVVDAAAATTAENPVIWPAIVVTKRPATEEEVAEDSGVALTTAPATSVNKPVISLGIAPATRRCLATDEDLSEGR